VGARFQRKRLTRELLISWRVVHNNLNVAQHFNSKSCLTFKILGKLSLKERLKLGWVSCLISLTKKESHIWPFFFMAPTYWLWEDSESGSFLVNILHHSTQIPMECLCSGWVSLSWLWSEASLVSQQSITPFIRSWLMSSNPSCPLHREGIISLSTHLFSPYLGVIALLLAFWTVNNIDCLKLSSPFPLLLGYALAISVVVLRMRDLVLPLWFGRQ
jgi:hypothetical protein